MEYLFSLPDLFLYFVLYAFMGWILESVYRSVTEKKWFINSGFLHNPVIPIYGFGSLIILYFIYFTQSWLFVWQVLSLMVILTIFEYFTGWLMETIFKIKLWDYSNFFLNIKGRICLFNTVAWAGLAIVFLKVIHPFGHYLVNLLANDSKFYVGTTLISVVIIDAFISMLELKVTANYINKIARNLENVNEQIRQILNNAVKIRFFRKFPNLAKLIEKSLKGNVADAIKSESADSVWKQITKILKRQDIKYEELNPEYYRIIEDLLDHDEVKRMNEFMHHHKTTLHHVLTVSEISWLLARKYSLDDRSTARGALLHDFFLYSWQTDHVEKHATKHPERALANAAKHFDLNDTEKEIIVKHMWPITKSWFKTKEALLVSIIDKVVSTTEVAAMGSNITSFIPKKKKKAGDSKTSSG